MTKRTGAASAAARQQQSGRLTRRQAKATGVTVAASFDTPPDKRARRRAAPSKKKEEKGVGKHFHFYCCGPETNPQAPPSLLESSGGEVSEAAARPLLGGSETGAEDLFKLPSDQLVALILELQADKEQLAMELQLQREISAQKTAELEEARRKPSEMPQTQEPKGPEALHAATRSPPRHSFISRIFGPIAGVLSPLTSRKRSIEAVVPASEPAPRTLDLDPSATRPYKRLRLEAPFPSPISTPTTRPMSPPNAPFEPQVMNKPLAQADDADMSDSQAALTPAPAETPSETPPGPEIVLDTLFAPHKLPESIRGIRIDRSTGKLINSMMPLRRRRIRDEMERQYTLWDQRSQEHLQKEDDRTHAVREATQIAYNLVLDRWPDSNVNRIREENCIYHKPGSFNATIPKASEHSRAPEHLRPQLPDMPQPRSIKALEHPELETPTPKMPIAKIPAPKTPTSAGALQDAESSPGRTFAFPYEDLDESSMWSIKEPEERRRSVGRTFRCPSSPLSSSTDDEDEPLDTTMRDISMITPSDAGTVTSSTPIQSHEVQRPNLLYVDHPTVTEEALRLKQRTAVVRAEYEEFIAQRQRDRETQGIVATTADERNRFSLLDNNAWADLIDVRRKERLEREQEKRNIEFHPWDYADMIARQNQERLAHERAKDQKSSDEELARLFELAKKREKAALYGEESQDPASKTGSGPWKFGQTNASSQAKVQDSIGRKDLPPFNPVTDTGPWLFSEPRVQTTTSGIVGVSSVAPAKKSAELDQQPSQGKQSEGSRPEQQAESNLMTPTTSVSIESRPSSQLDVQTTTSAGPDASAQALAQMPKLPQQLDQGKRPEVSQPEQRAALELTAEAVSQQQVLAKSDSTVTPPPPIPKHAQLPVQPSSATDEATDAADWQKTQLERKMRDLDRYKPKAASRLRNVSRLSSSPALAQASPKSNFEARDEDSDRFSSPTDSPGNLILQQPVGDFSRGAKRPFSEEGTCEEVWRKRQALDEFVTPLSYDNLTPEEEDEVRLYIHNQDRENDKFMREVHGGPEAFKQLSKAIFPSTLLQRPDPPLCTPEEQREVDEFIRQQVDANPSFIRDAYGDKEGFLTFTNILFPGTLEACSS